MAGRKRKLGPRKPCGRLQQRQIGPDRGTPEQVARRIALLGSHDAVGELDNPLTRIRKALSQEQYWAAKKACTVFGRYCAAIGAPRVTSPQFAEYIEGSPVSPMSEEAQKHAVDEYKALIEVLSLYSRASLREVERLMRGAPFRNLDTLKSGLVAYAQHLGYYKTKAA